jgi:uncharacterized protein with GYD domain
MFGNYASDAVDDISAERTVKANAVIGDMGGEFKGGYALLGDTDIVLIVDFPNIKKAMKASIELNKLLGISFSTAPAVTVDEFDKLIEG